MKKTMPLLIALVASVSLLMAQPSTFDFTANSAFGGIIATVEVNGNPASSSDWIAAFDEADNCAGAFQLVENGGQTFCNLLVYGNDATTADIDEGIDAGETFTFKLWVAATNEILDHPIDIEPVTGWNGGLNGSAVPGWDFPDGKVINFMRTIADEDGDGFAGADDPDDSDPCNPDNTVAVCDTDGDGIPDGSDPFPNCNGEEDECGVCNGPGIVDGTCDCDGTPAATWYADTDGDGKGDPDNSTDSCEQPDGFVANADDDDDTDPGCISGIFDECGVCDGLGIAAGTCDCDGTAPTTWYADADGDGLGDASNSTESCEQPDGFVANADDDCDTGTDECGVCGGSGPATWYADADGDGLGDPNNATQNCTRPGGFVSNNNDTDDTVNNTADVPTLSQWGLILLSLILLSITTVSIIQNKYSLANNKGGSVSASSILPYFDAALFRRMLLKSVPLMLIIFVVISFIEDGWFIRNLVGAVLSTGIVIYIWHFVVLSERFVNKLEE